MVQHAPGYYAWSATVDGDFLPASPDSLVSSDPIKPVVNAKTVLVGLVQDEGSLTGERVVSAGDPAAGRRWPVFSDSYL